jgi:hypothetical protein
MGGSHKIVVDTGSVLQVLEQERIRRRMPVSAWAHFLDLSRTAYPKLGTTRTLPSTGTLMAIATRLGWLFDELLVGANADYDQVREQRLTSLLAERAAADNTAEQLGAATAALPLPRTDPGPRAYAILEAHMDELTRAFHSMVDGLSADERQLAYAAVKRELARHWSAGARAEDSLQQSGR